MTCGPFSFRLRAAATTKNRQTHANRAYLPEPISSALQKYSGGVARRAAGAEPLLETSEFDRSAVAVPGKASGICRRAPDGVGFVNGFLILGLRIAVIDNSAPSLDI